jgi:hypothetical protein
METLPSASSSSQAAATISRARGVIGGLAALSGVIVAA